MEDWWTEEDSKEYEARVKVMVDQANQYEVHGQKVKGALTSGENIADIGGMRLALRALKSTPGYDPTQLIDGFTPIQRFFLSWSQCWRQNHQGKITSIIDTGPSWSKRDALQRYCIEHA